MPVCSETVTDTSLGMIAVMISGSRLFNDYETPQRSIVAMDDQNTEDGASFLDDCNAHLLQNGSAYHYNASPPCLSETVDGEGSHAIMMGVLLDGFPIFGPQGDGGTIITNADLDGWSGRPARFCRGSRKARDRKAHPDRHTWRRTPTKL